MGSAQLFTTVILFIYSIINFSIKDSSNDKRHEY